MQGQRSTARRTLAASAALAFAFTALGLTSARAGAVGAHQREYVALGDSGTSGPGILPAEEGAPANCGRSARNYPHLTAEALGLELKDASCSGAKVADMYRAQYGDQPPQFDALSTTTDVVTLSIGGNDNDTFLKAVYGCGLLDSLVLLDLGAPCQALYGDSLSTAIAADEANLAAALQEIHRRSPRAEVFVVGYPAFFPPSGSCRPQVPLTTGDVAFVHGLFQDLNGMMRRAAAGNDAVYIDAYTPSLGHDMCQDAATRWVEPYTPAPGVATAHPNAAGHTATATVVADAMQAPGR